MAGEEYICHAAPLLANSRFTRAWPDTNLKSTKGDGGSRGQLESRKLKLELVRLHEQQSPDPAQQH